MTDASAALSNFVHLRVHSAYSLAEGAIKIDKALDMCVHYNMPAMAVTDTNNVFGAMEMCYAAVKKAYSRLSVARSI